MTIEPAPTRVSRRRRASGDPSLARWDHVAYELEPLPLNAGWVGLSEITAVPGGYIVLERDNLTGDFAGAGRLFVVTDNDGVEDWSGETWFLRLGHYRNLFR